jgi:hypothetical protein
MTFLILVATFPVQFLLILIVCEFVCAGWFCFCWGSFTPFLQFSFDFENCTNNCLDLLCSFAVC